jgi:hypothetical protein
MTSTTIQTTSHWKQGCDDARAGNAPRRPHPVDTIVGLDYVERLANQGYMNGYRFGALRKVEEGVAAGTVPVYQPALNEGSEP